MQKTKLSLEFFRKAGSQGGKKAASKMTKAERTVRAREAGKARQAKAATKGGKS